ncbi:aminoglycoside phosphotransferase family protein [Phytohabitans sp. ZYX-F-186]|uniref:Aminoglycoside phosphotransferase family protein n=1 Tax=Phytohabitans maris TaxID=3071409 RepID=A0ABU0ZPY5_9ACTN|nr:aminoglycoside phosphotransferase family protein [Phytohabitans sp. ZYX-F-186]MDQ7909104.1 aminoglycoside phosphotransferase family protein [Phytohabitans sp. ZYX-F-186]
MNATDDILRAACQAVGLDHRGAEIIRSSENTLYRLQGGIVARVTRHGQLPAAEKEVRVSRWLASLGVPVVEALPDLKQPVAVDGRAVTFWRELPAHRYSTLGELATVLRRLHRLPAPDFDLPPIAPFVRQRERITEATALEPHDRRWLLDHLTDLEARFADLPAGLPWCAVHGDAWAGNVVVADHEPILLDLERFALGPPEWDLTSIAVDYTTFGDMTAEQWAQFSASYGYDVTTWDGFQILRDARELRKVTFAIQIAADRPDVTAQARYRLRCIQGKQGPRPWGWVGVP